MNGHIDLNAIRDEAPVEEFSDELTDEALDREKVATACICASCASRTRAPRIED